MVVKGILIGAGMRGNTYASYALHCPEAFRIVAVSEPDDYRREKFKKKFNLTDERCYKDWKHLVTMERFADCVLICTQDKDHAAPAVAAAKKGYHILLEKPMAVTPEDCRSIYASCTENNVKLSVCHVLRYHPCVQKLKEVIDSGLIGDVVNINHVEPVGFWHFAHSFVRGNWRNTSESTFSLLSKSCHDVDLIYYWMNFKKCTAISSFGSLLHFKKENKPPNSGERCLDCNIEPSCPYSAKKIYLDPKPSSPMFPMKAVCDIEDSSEGYLYHLEKAIQNGPYGKCVYDTDNNVCDNQVVNFQFENGATASLTMIAFSKDVCDRKTSIYGTKGELRWDDLHSYSIQHYDFLTRKMQSINCDKRIDAVGWGHGGSDFYVIKNFVDSISSDAYEDILTGPEISLSSHLLTFAAEQSRISGATIKPSLDIGWDV